MGMARAVESAAWEVKGKQAVAVEAFARALRQVYLHHPLPFFISQNNT